MSRPNKIVVYDDEGDKQCNIYAKFKARKSGFFGTELNGYDGIPQNLVLNIIGWFIIIIIFGLIRKRAWNYGRIALVQRTMDVITREKFEMMERLRLMESNRDPSGDHDVPTGIASDEDEPFLPMMASQGKIIYTDPEGPDFCPNQQAYVTELTETEQAKYEQALNQIVVSRERIMVDDGYFGWIKIIISLSDKQYFETCGYDCVQYLSFQRHLIFLTIMMTLVSLSVILPLNLKGSTALLNDNDEVEESSFNQTIITNLKHAPHLLWAHVIVAFVYLIMCVVVMRHFSTAMKLPAEEDDITYRSVMIIGVARKYCYEEKIRGHFEEVYPDAEIEEVTFAHNLTRLQKIDSKRVRAQIAKVYWESVATNSTVQPYRPSMRTHVCGAICSDKLCCCHSSVDAISYYTIKERKYEKLVVDLRDDALTKPLGIVFVTFKTIEMSERLVSDYRFIPKLFCLTPKSKLSKQMKSTRWAVGFAPQPDDIIWENLSGGLNLFYVKGFLVNVFLALMITFLTTPVYLIRVIIPLLNISKDFIVPVRNLSDNSTNETLTVQTIATFLSGVLYDTVPTLLIWILALTLPSLVSVSDKIVGFWTKTAENRSKMVKVFSFLFFMVIILPALGITSLTAIINRDFNTSFLNWDCVYSKSNGALFVNYVCTATFLGTASELMRLPELIIYSFKILFAKSNAELAAIRRTVLWDFQIGPQYAWMMLVFALFSIFSVVFPLITPFGLVYFILKHYVDRYNMFFAYGPTKVDKEVHLTAVNFVLVCVFILQLNLMSYVTSQNQTDKAVAPSTTGGRSGLEYLAIIGFGLTAAVVCLQLCCSMCASFTPLIYASVTDEGILPKERTPRYGKGRRASTRPSRSIDRSPRISNVVSTSSILPYTESSRSLRSRHRSTSRKFFPNILYPQANPKSSILSSPSTRNVSFESQKLTK